MAPRLSVAAPARGKPFLLPHNRRLRHVKAISLRNLTIAPEFWRRRSETVDDDALPQSTQSPTKLRSRQHRRSLEQSRSSTDLAGLLRPIDENVKKAKDEAGLGNIKSPSRAVPKRPRRRSTLDSGGSNPTVRQKQLEDEVRHGLLDVFFSLHVEEVEDPIYISEICEETMNPSFRAFTLFDSDSAITRLASLTIKVWAKAEAEASFGLLLQLAVNMRHLQFIGKTLESYRRPFPSNTVLFHLKDGIYTTFLEGLAPIAPGPSSSEIKPLPTSSYDALMRLSSLDIAIQDALAARKRLEAEISDLLSGHSTDIATVQSVVSSQDLVLNTKNAVLAETKRLTSARHRRDQLLEIIKARKDFMKESREFDASQMRLVESGQAGIKEKQDSIIATKDGIHGQQRRVCEDVQRIFPIEPIVDAPSRSLAFSIRGLHLPNASLLDDADSISDANSVAAALGYTAQLITQLAAYLNIPLPYRLEFRGSNSIITDSLSASTPTTTYPLFSRSVARFRFEYAVFLLNKDIEIIANALGLKLLDPRHTLPNLKYILFVASSGQGELPARKVGGLRAFLTAQDGDRLPWTLANGSAPGKGSRLRYET